LPEIVSREEWLEARLAVHRGEQETRRRDALNAERRRLPMVRIEKDYVFDGPQGPVTLLGLFGDNRQLITQHLTFGPAGDAPLTTGQARPIRSSPSRSSPTPKATRSGLPPTSSDRSKGNYARPITR